MPRKKEKKKNSLSDNAYLKDDYLKVSAQNKIMCLHYNKQFQESTGDSSNKMGS